MFLILVRNQKGYQFLTTDGIIVVVVTINGLLISNVLCETMEVVIVHPKNNFIPILNRLPTTILRPDFTNLPRWSAPDIINHSNYVDYFCHNLAIQIKSLSDYIKSTKARIFKD